MVLVPLTLMPLTSGTCRNDWAARWRSACSWSIRWHRPPTPAARPFSDATRDRSALASIVTGHRLIRAAARRLAAGQEPAAAGQVGGDGGQGQEQQQPENPRGPLTLRVPLTRIIHAAEPTSAGHGRAE